MIGVEHRLAKQALKKEVPKIRLLLSNTKGSYLMLPSSDASRYDGFFVYDESMFKIIDSFGIELRSLSYSVTSATANNTKFALHPNHNALKIKPTQSLVLDFDVRHSYDLRKWGKNYSISEEEGVLLVKFVKTTDNREDDTHGKIEYEFYIAIMHDGKHELLDEWVNKYYEHDKQRNSEPCECFVYRAASIKANNLLIAVSREKEEAISLSKNLFKFKPENVKPQKISDDKQITIAYNESITALNRLYVNGRLFAGLPWFFQAWTRDEAISTGAFISREEYGIAKDLLFRELNFIQPDGRLSNRIPGTDTGSADATGWCLYRLKQILDIGKLDKTEVIFLTAKLEYIYEKYVKNHIKENLVHNSAKETWMDTEHSGDDRAGVRIEIQALQLSLYQLLFKLTQDAQFRQKEQDLKAQIRKKLWDGERLADGLGDFTQRPNIFLAYYLYPDLLPAEEWTKAFEHALKELWLEWGGLATISKNNQLFHDTHTGENQASYHRGDSWYWINNLAALCMYRLNKIKFREEIFQIMEASTNEILWSGAAGHHAELSSASKQESQGCFSQAWSMAMYIELVNELFG